LFVIVEDPGRTRRGFFMGWRFARQRGNGTQM